MIHLDVYFDQLVDPVHVSQCQLSSHAPPLLVGFTTRQLPLYHMCTLSIHSLT